MIALRIEVVPRQGYRRQGYIGWAERDGVFVRRTLRHSHEVVCRGDLETWAGINKEVTGEDWGWSSPERREVEERGEAKVKKEGARGAQGKRVRTLEERKAWGAKMNRLRKEKRERRLE